MDQSRRPLLDRTLETVGGAMTVTGWLWWLASVWLREVPPSGAEADRRLQIGLIAFGAVLWVIGGVGRYAKRGTRGDS